MEGDNGLSGSLQHCWPSVLNWVSVHPPCKAERLKIPKKFQIKVASLGWVDGYYIIKIILHAWGKEPCKTI